MLNSRLQQISNIQAVLIEDSDRRTTVKTRFVAEGQQVLRADDESNKPLSAAAQARLLAESTGP